MVTRDHFADYCADLLEPLGSVRTKRMFGGHGIYVDDVFIAIVVGDTLFLKTDALTRERFQAAGSREFTYTAKGQVRRSLGYWSAPAEAMDSPALMRPWAQLAMAAALRARK